MCRQLFRDSCFYLLFLQQWADGVPYHSICLYTENSLPHPILPGAFILPKILICLFQVPAEPIAVGYNIFLGTLLILLVFFCMQALCPQKKMFALSCAFLAAVHPSLIEFSATVLCETTYLVLCATFFLCLFHWIRSMKVQYAVLCGICSGLAILTRIEGVEFLLFTLNGIFFFARPLSRKGMPVFLMYLIGVAGSLFMLSLLTGIDLSYFGDYYVFDRIIPHFQYYFRTHV